MDALARVLVTPQRLPNPALVGKSAMVVASKVGIKAPEGTRALVAPLTGVGRDFPLSIEKLCPVLSWYVVRDWREGCERCIQILRYGGMGHTMAVHSTNDEIILQFGLRKPAFRICVNTPTTHGSIGLTTGLDPAMTLGCGGWGGNITSDNISPKHLLNIKRLAYEVRPAVTASRPQTAAAASSAAAPAAVGQAVGQGRPEESRLPKAPERPVVRGISAQTLADRIDQFLSSRGYHPPDEPAASRETAGGGPAFAAKDAGSVASPPARSPLAAVPALATAGADAAGGTLANDGSTSAAAEFVCEDDVRAALRAGRKLVVGEKTIITPSARDLGEAQKVFVQAGWPR
jgi:acetaldehyde dehydrogenase (acetylating)